jgi:hypothetical protein
MHVLFFRPCKKLLKYRSSNRVICGKQCFVLFSFFIIKEEQDRRQKYKDQQQQQAELAAQAKDICADYI